MPQIDGLKRWRLIYSPFFWPSSIFQANLETLKKLDIGARIHLQLSLARSESNRGVGMIYDRWNLGCRLLFGFWNLDRRANKNSYCRRECEIFSRSRSRSTKANFPLDQFLDSRGELEVPKSNRWMNLIGSSSQRRENFHSSDVDTWNTNDTSKLQKDSGAEFALIITLNLNWWSLPILLASDCDIQDEHDDNYLKP